ncbi:MAG: TadE/TadG family type IV pilus assembly protein [Coriobacteriales bacterium]
MRGGDSGQATVEFLVVMAAFLAMVMAIGTLSGRLGDGMLVQNASENAAYSVESPSDAARRILIF